jgi:hypothetical protein
LLHVYIRSNLNNEDLKAIAGQSVQTNKHLKGKKKHLTSVDLFDTFCGTTVPYDEKKSHQWAAHPIFYFFFINSFSSFFFLFFPSSFMFYFIFLIHFLFFICIFPFSNRNTASF